MNHAITNAALSILAVFASLAIADEPADGEVKPASAGAKPASLFAGPVAKQWKEADYGGIGIVEFKDGVLSLGSGDPITAIRWTGELGDGPGQLPKMNYRIEYEARRVLGSDFFATVTFPVGDAPCSLVVGGWGGGLTGISSLNGDDAANNMTTGYTAFENDKWYKFAINVTPETITATQDGEQMFVPIRVDEYQIGIRIEMEPCRPLGIATYHSSGEIRNFSVTRLATKSAEKAAPGDKQE